MLTQIDWPSRQELVDPCSKLESSSKIRMCGFFEAVLAQAHHYRASEDPLQLSDLIEAVEFVSDHFKIEVLDSDIFNNTDRTELAQAVGKLELFLTQLRLEGLIMFYLISQDTHYLL